MTSRKVTKCLLGNILEEVDMSQIELSRRTGIHKSQISSYVNTRYGKTMELAHARKICKVLGIDNPYDLYEWSDNVTSRRTDD
uniref:helix-turn-helix domain-containing protein n=1 Tax=Paenibacillus sp. FSL R5-0519 TaxID=2921648 RepID=UPI00403FBC62